MPRKIFAVLLYRLSYPAGLAMLATCLIAVSGCSSGNSLAKLQVGAINFADVNGTPLKTPPTSLTVGQNAYVDVTLTNDPDMLGADWGVYCGSKLPPGTPLPPGQTQDPSCGTFTPAHTMSGSIPTYVTSGAGYVTLYSAPAAPPKQGVVTLYAYATSDHSKLSSVTLTINALPVSIQFAPPPPSTLAVSASVQIKAVLNNDPANAGAKWSAICGAGDCGSFSPAQTANGVETTYTAPAGVPGGNSVQVTATSITDPTKTVTATIQIEPNSMAADRTVAGKVQAGLNPVSDARVVLYAAAASDSAPNHAANDRDASTTVSAMTDAGGNFVIPSGYECPTPDTQMYLIASGGNAGGGPNPDLAFMAALGLCSDLAASNFVVNEATTVAAVYALSDFMTDPRKIGSGSALPSGMASAFATAKDLVDVATGLIRTRTVSGKGVVPLAEIDAMANLLNACASTAGSSPGDDSACDQLFRATNAGITPPPQRNNTAQALLNLARNATGFTGNPDAFPMLWRLARSSDSFQPSLSVEPNDWRLAIQFPAGQGSLGSVSTELSADGFATSAASPSAISADSAGNLWMRGKGDALTEFVGGASYAEAPKMPAPVAASSETVP